MVWKEESGEEQGATRSAEGGGGRGEVCWLVGIELFPCDERSINWLDDLFCASLLRY